MPLSPPAERDLLHLRDLAMRGYWRADGLFDIEGRLTDHKTASPANSTGQNEHPQHRPVHDLSLRLTVNENLEIVACEAASDHTPYDICPLVAPNFAALAGLKIGPGFNKRVQERVGGVLGCTHLREMLAQLATVAFQTLYPVRRKQELARQAAELAGEPPGPVPPLRNSCYAYAEDSTVTLQRWPHLAKAQL
jgi:hypothetical protein